MPEKVAVELEARIAELVGQHRSELAQLVEQRLAARNGATHEPAQAPRARSEPATKLCDGCGEAKPAAAFEKYRRRCRECRRRDARERDRRRVKAEPDPTVPVAIEPAEPGRPDVNAWLVDAGFAKQVGNQLVPTDLGARVGSDIVLPGLPGP